MRPGRIVALIIGFVLVAPGVGMVFGGGAMTLVATQRDADGYATTTVALASSTAAITTDDVTYHIDADTPGWVLDALETDVRLEVVDSAGDVFVGIAPASEIDGWLSGVSHDQIADVGVATGDVTYRTSPGTDGAGTPTDQPFW
ncbi:MAG TPA: hypothetical protein VJ978_06655, partial [Nitriliruptoraceae bacterium]|nr:hypothetical protein [Nitriliruptoraceae bacterium]